MKLNGQEITQAELRAECEAALDDKAVTNISGWTEPNCDVPCDESAYRERLVANGPVFVEKVKEALKFD